MSRALAAYEPCGCCAAISVMGDDGGGAFGAEETAAAYAMAAREAKRGLRIEEVDVAEWKMRGLFCAEHKPDGPPWWPANGRKGKRADWKPPVVQAGLGL